MVLFSSGPGTLRGGGLTTRYGGLGYSSANNSSPYDLTFANLWTPQSSDAVLLAFYRSVASSDPAISMDAAIASTVTKIDNTFGAAAGRASVAAWTMRGVAKGSPLSVLFHGISSYGKMVVVVYDLFNWSGYWARAAGESYNGATVTGRTLSAAVTKPNSQLIALGGEIAGASGNYSASGWTEDAEGGTNSGTATVVSAAAYRKTAGAVGAGVSFPLVSTVSWTDWAELILELY